MKKILIVLAVAVAGLVLYNYATTGELSLTPKFSQSEDERAVDDLEQQLDAAKKQFAQAHRSAAVGGIDTTADVAAASRAVKRIRRELDGLTERLSSDSAKRRADELSRAIEEFSQKLK
jgi:hypothetical protein